jgi:hypothetical protein
VSDANDEERLKADIVAARAELAETADALAAKLDVKAQASEKLHAAGARARAATPEPVQKALGKAEVAAQPVINAAAEDKKRTAMIVGGMVFALLVLKRLRKSKKAAD